MGTIAMKTNVAIGVSAAMITMQVAKLMDMQHTISCMVTYL